jgi:putative membrane protein
MSPSPDDPTPTTAATYPRALFWASVGVCVISGFAPHYRADWWLENLVVLVTLPFLIAGYFRRPFSNGAYTCLFLFLGLHEIGAHYTYSEVPYEEWWAAVAATPLRERFSLQRNHYDRLVHFAYGLLLFRPAKELHATLLNRGGVWLYALTFSFLVSLSAIYELVEGGAALLFAGDLGMAYLGTQGDIWDAQKDMTAAALGALLALAWTASRSLTGSSTTTRASGYWSD